MFPLRTMFKGNVYKLAMFTGKHLCWSLFFIKMQASRSVTLLKNDCNTGAFLWILQKNFKCSLFYRPPPMAVFPGWRKNDLQSICLGLLKLSIFISAQVWKYYFWARTDCLVEQMLRQTRWFSDRTSGKPFFKKNKTSRVFVAL